MFILGNFIEALARIVNIGLTLYMWLIIIRALISWVNPDPYNPLVRFLYRATEPLLYRVRRWIPLRGLGMDFSPIIVIPARTASATSSGVRVLAAATRVT